MATSKLLWAGTSALLRLQCEHLRDFLVRQSVAIELKEIKVATPEDLQAAVKAEEPAVAIRMDPILSGAWIEATAVQPLNVSHLQTADVFWSRHGEWVPGLLFEKSLHDLIVKQGKSLDLRDSAYVIGFGPSLRIAAAVVLGLGFHNVNLVGEDVRDLEEQKRILDHLFHGANIQPLPADALTLQTVGASILVNTLDLRQKPEFAADLAYFNFMRRGGLVMDLMAIEKDNPILEEAMRAELRIVPPHEISGGVEWALLESLGLAGSLKKIDFFNSWFERLRSENLTSV